LQGRSRLAHDSFVTIGRGEALFLDGFPVVSGHGHPSRRREGPVTQSSSRRNDSFARVKEAENQTTGERTTFDAEVRSARRLRPIPAIGWGHLKYLNLR